MILLVGALTIGLILSLLALGVYISFRIFNFPDITADGFFVLGVNADNMIIIGLALSNGLIVPPGTLLPSPWSLPRTGPCGILPSTKR